MKICLLAVWLFFVGGVAFAQTPPHQSMGSSSGPMTLSVDSEAKELARGYARAFASLSRPPITLVFQKDGQVYVLEDVKNIRDSDAVLIVEVGKGLIYLIDPRTIVYITDGRTLAPKP